MSHIISYCHIKTDKCFVNGQELNFKRDSSSFLKSLYHNLNLDYSKFHKMDKLAKIGFLGTELLKEECPEIKKYNDNEIALLFSNKNSSALTDLKFQESYNNGGSPSPALFVYTLPNILLGEIAIRNKWYGESIFSISPKFDPNYFINNTTILLNKKSTASLCGWINLSDNEIDAFFFFVAKKDLKQLNLQLNSTQLLELFNNDTKK